MEYKPNKIMQLALNLAQLCVLEAPNNYANKMVCKVSKEQLIEKFIENYPTFFYENKIFILDYIENHIKFKN